MALVEETLKTQLKAMILYDNESDAIDAWADAFATYFQGATSLEVVILPAAVLAAKEAMKGAMATVIVEEEVTVEGLSLDAGSALQLGITAFWGVLVAAPASAWPTTTVITPPVGLATLKSNLDDEFLLNIAGPKTKNESLDAIAGIIHTNNEGGTATWPGPAVEDIA